MVGFQVWGSEKGGPAQGTRARECELNVGIVPVRSARNGFAYCAGKGEWMADFRSNRWESIKEQGYTPLCIDWNADGTEMVCEVFIDAGSGGAECITCRLAYRKDERGNLEYYR
jgi:hypothetical protein